MNKTTCTPIKAGTRFIKQGEIRDTAYVIQRGACLLIAEKNGSLHPVGHLGRGDIIGVRISSRHMNTAVSRFRGQASPQDDLTFVLIKVI